MSSNTESVKVIVRCRPFSNSEKERKCQSCVKIEEMKTVTVSGSSSADPSATKPFTFDFAFDQESKQTDVFDLAAKNIVDALLEGYNGTIFAYGQTGSGKTFTMQGLSDDPERSGIIPNTFKYIFHSIEQRPERKYLVSISYLELYNEEIRDLLVKSSERKSLDLKENIQAGSNGGGFYVKELGMHTVKHWKEMEDLMTVGNRSRAVGATLMNEQSSRSHSIFSIYVESCLQTGGQVVAGKLHLVDLAGSERQSKTGATGDRLKEATKINLSLTALGNCISALVDKKPHIPYRDSKLTKLLQDSLGGNSKTMMIATFSPADYNAEETISTLRYANRAKNIKNSPKMNIDPKDAKLKEFQDEIAKLKALLEERQQKGGKPATATPQKVQARSNSTTSTESAAGKQNGAAGDSLMSDLKKQEKELEEERLKREDLQRKLQELESQVIVGGLPLEEHVTIQEKALKQTNNELTDKKAKQSELKRQVQKRAGDQNQLEEKYVSLQEEIDIKTKKMEKLWEKLRELKQERGRLAEEWANERVDLQETMRDLTRELALKEKITSLFIPDDWADDFDRRLIYDEDLQDWTVSKSEMVNLRLKDRGTVPTSLYGRMKSMENDSPSIRYYPRNIYRVPLERPADNLRKE